MLKKISQLVLILAGAVICSAGLASAAASFTGLGDLPGGGPAYSYASDVSADGSVVVGAGESDLGREPFVWTRTTGMVGLGGLPGGTLGSFPNEASGVSADGTVIVGYCQGSSGVEAFRWTQSGGMVGLGDLPGGTFYSIATAISRNGSVIVGGSNSGQQEAFRWTQSSGMVGLGDLPGGASSSSANGVSGDGSIIVGQGTSSLGDEASRWTQAGGIVGLGDLAGGIFYSNARGVSADGSVIVGASDSSLGYQAFLWTQSGGMIGLGDLPGGGFVSYATAVSDDGLLVVGRSNTSQTTDEAFIWDKVHGMRRLQDVLENEYGLNLAGWILVEPTAIVGDGSGMGYAIVGYGVNPSGITEAYLAIIPEPATLSLLAVGAVALIRRRRK